LLLAQTQLAVVLWPFCVHSPSSSYHSDVPLVRSAPLHRTSCAKCTRRFAAMLPPVLLTLMLLLLLHAVAITSA